MRSSDDPTSDQSPKRVLLVRPTALGDVARTVPALVTLRNACPDAHIDWLVEKSYAPLLASHPSLSGVVPFARKQLGRMWRSPAAAMEVATLFKQLRHARYDLVVDLQGLLRSGIFTRVTGAKRRIGLANAREGAAMAYTEKYHLDPQMHTVDRMVGLLASAGFTPSYDMRLYPQSQDVTWVNDYLSERGGSELPYACIAPTAQWFCKCWPIEYYIKLVRDLLQSSSLEKAGKRVVVIFAPHEQPHVQPLLDAFADNPAVMAPRMTIGQMLAMLSKSSLVVCNDSGPLHMAVGLGRPIVSLFGPTDPEVVGPYKRMETVVSPGPVDLATQRYFRRNKQDQSLIAQVTFEQVISKAEEQLG